MPSRKTDSANSLRRGSACLCCRRRKLKCDGLRPVCHQCTKMRRADECYYDDSKKKSRTQMLREKLAMLEDKVRELESDASGSNPPGSFNSSPIPSLPHSLSPESEDLTSLLSQPSQPLDISSWLDASSAAGSSLTSSPDSVATWSEMASGSSSSSSSIVSPSPPLRPPRSISLGSPLLALDTSTIGDTKNYHNNSNPLTAVPFSPYESRPDWEPSQPLPSDTHTFLLGTFMAHRHQCCFYSDMNRFNMPLHQQGDQPHPALMNAIYLLACHFARSPLCSQLEEMFLTQTLQEITLCLHNSDQLVDVIQASCLLATYYFFNGRPLEGYRHSFSAARLAVGLGLHQIRPPDGFTFSGMVGTEIADRISAFWQVFMVDKSWTAANGLISALPEEKAASLRILTPLPTAFDELTPNVSAFNSSIYAIFERQSPAFQMLSLSSEAFKATAVALYDRTSRLATGSSVSHKEGSFWNDYRSSEIALGRLRSIIPSFAGREAWRTTAPYIDVDTLAVHTFISVSSMHLQQDDDDAMKISWAANSIVELIKQVHEDDYQFLDPIIAVCWSDAAQTLIRRSKFIEKTANIYDDSASAVHFIKHCINVLANSTKSIHAFSPVSGELTKAIEQEWSH
ncbi:hypothetical protein BDQ12DRAFT_761049 [Crucibulum laeve]|uniref:Zn(2)-C6 fungal-type domain-containing protein n=1 Tax=Crucibulum laeve TaxID=68775 RepID=A0A5C3LP04_9AGAR|nr:hypothetical protein BDQ12DRAFT_761049 [Crucibulum laeve]